jgi:hypothetical protein
MTVEQFLRLFNNMPAGARLEFEDEDEDGIWDECDGVRYDRGRVIVKIRLQGAPK